MPNVVALNCVMKWSGTTRPFSRGDCGRSFWQGGRDALSAGAWDWAGSQTPHRRAGTVCSRPPRRATIAVWTVTSS